jgi:glycosidase
MQKRIYTGMAGFLLLLLLAAAPAKAQQRVSKVILQAFWWDYWNNNYRFGWANYLTELAPRLKAMGVDAIWIPPASKNQSAGSVGYAPFDHYDLGDKYQKQNGDTTRLGTKDELLRMIAVMHANGIEVIADMVLNHNSDAAAVGGQDPETGMSMQSAGGFKNFRYVSYRTPRVDESLNDYWTRSGRWPKNYQNFHPNYANVCNSGDICGTFWGPDIDYATPGAFGQSSNIPPFGSVNVGGVNRPFHNPPQSSNYMLNNGREYMAWFKKQTNADGFRFDAVKHYSIPAQRDFILHTKYNLPSFANGGQDMLSIGEWVGNQFNVDDYVTNVAGGGEEHTGTYDFALRGYSSNGSGIYGMVLGNGGYDMQNLPACQQSKRFYDYGAKRVHRTVPFVNSHDTYRPRLNANGDFLRPLGDASGWDEANELGSNGRHIDPREPRLAAAYAAVFAVDGNPAIYFEDVFDIGTTGKRWTHRPTNTTDLPLRSDIQNIVQAHQKLGFKMGDYAVPTALSGAQAPFYQAGTSGDHLVLERRGRAIIGVTDAFSSVSNNTSDQQVWVNVGDPSWIGKALYDYTGAHGITTTTVQPDGRVLIRTAPNGHNIPNAFGHGYSIWAPLPTGVTFSSVTDIYNYLSTFTPARSPITNQEWEMADDLGDSHCLSLGQGGRLPDNSMNERMAGKIFAAANQPITCTVSPEVDGRNLTVTLYNMLGDQVATASGVATAAAPLVVNYTPTADGWINMKVRNTADNYAGQRCWVRASYTAPQVVNTSSPAGSIPTNVSIWTGNKNNTNVADCGNWENGIIPGPNSHVIVYGHTRPFPVLNFNLTVNKVTVQPNASFTVAPGVNLTVLSQ